MSLLAIICLHFISLIYYVLGMMELLYLFENRKSIVCILYITVRLKPPHNTVDSSQGLNEIHNNSSSNSSAFQQ